MTSVLHSCGLKKKTYILPHFGCARECRSLRIKAKSGGICWNDYGGLQQCTGGSIQDIPQEKEMQKGKVVV